MATVYFQGKQWIAQWYGTDGKRVKRGTGIGKGKRREAERAAAEMEAKDRKQGDNTGRKFEEIVSRAGADAKAGRLTSDRAAEYLTEIRKVSDPGFKVLSLEEHLAAWCGEKGDRVKSKTAAGYADMKRRFSEALGAGVMSSPITELTRAHLEKAITKLKARGLKGSTINLDIRAMRQALAQAHDDGLVPRNVAAGIKSIAETDSTERAPFTAEEVRTMIDHEKTSDEWAGMILFGGHTGLRLRDAAQLGREHIDGTDLFIRPQKTERTKKVIRIPLTPPLLRWIDGRKGKFFPTLATKSSPALSMQFSAIMKRAEVPAKVTLPGGITASRSFHSLRHSFTSWLAEADIHADVRKKLTGHSSERSHARYTHHDESLRRAVETLPAISASARVQK